jgi:hypothetical protein
MRSIREVERFCATPGPLLLERGRASYIDVDLCATIAFAEHCTDAAPEGCSFTLMDRLR